MSFIGRWLDKLKVSMAAKYIGAGLKTLVPYIVSGLVAIGVDPELAKEFAANTAAVSAVVVTFLLDLALTALRTKRAG